MKKLILILIFSILVQAAQLHYEHNFKEALIKAQQQNKKVMMIYSAVWCPECNYMKDVVFKDKKVKSYLQKNFIILSLDIQKDKLPTGYKYIGIPTFFFLRDDATLIKTIEGGSKADKFLTKLKAVK